MVGKSKQGVSSHFKFEIPENQQVGMTFLLYTHARDLNSGELINTIHVFLGSLKEA